MTFHYQKTMIGAALGFSLPLVISNLNKNPYQMLGKYFDGVTTDGILWSLGSFFVKMYVIPVVEYHRTLDPMRLGSISDIDIPSKLCFSATLGTSFAIVKTTFKMVQEKAEQNPHLLKACFLSMFAVGYAASEEVVAKDPELVDQEAQCTGNITLCEVDEIL